MRWCVSSMGGRYGVDVASVRADDLDKLMLTYAAAHPGARVIDIGCGSGGQSERLAAVGASVVGLDREDHRLAFAERRTISGLDESRLAFQQGDVRELAKSIEGQSFAIVCVQRMLHYLTYEEAEKFLQNLHHAVTDRLYISVSGLDSDIGRAYSCREAEIDARFCSLTKKDAETFFITEPICLYTQAEFTELLQVTGWHIEKLWTSAFGNHKAICLKQ